MCICMSIETGFPCWLFYWFSLRSSKRCTNTVWRNFMLIIVLSHWARSYVVFQNIHIPREAYLTNSACFINDLFHFFPGVCWGTNVISDHDFPLKKRVPCFQNKLLTFSEPRLVNCFMFIYCRAKVRPLNVSWKLPLYCNVSKCIKVVQQILL